MTSEKGAVLSDDGCLHRFRDIEELFVDAFLAVDMDSVTDLGEDRQYPGRLWDC